MRAQRVRVQLVQSPGLAVARAAVLPDHDERGVPVVPAVDVRMTRIVVRVREVGVPVDADVAVIAAIDPFAFVEPEKSVRPLQRYDAD